MSKSKQVKINPTLAKLLIDIDPGENVTLYIVKSPAADTEGAKLLREKTIYGVRLTEGVGVTTDAAAAEQIKTEFPDYIITETN